jgi:8-oxo-dGTP pyrophosphatase MutT (NUDIX family)
METKILVIAIVKKDDRILMRKKPDGSLPYKETWYSFGGELVSNKTPEQILQAVLIEQAGIEIELKEQISWATEIKNDVDGVEKLFVYLNTICEYKSGDLVPGKGIEKLEWVSIDKLSEYDIVPPSKKLFRSLGYLK